MTRINVGIHPSELPDKLLLAEHREITRIPNMIRNGRAILTNPIDRFTLGAGHVRFFYSRLGYLRRRYAALLQECRIRGFNVTDKTDAFDNQPGGSLGDYSPTFRDRMLLVERITSKGFQLLPLRDDATHTQT